MSLSTRLSTHSVQLCLTHVETFIPWCVPTRDALRYFTHVYTSDLSVLFLQAFPGLKMREHQRTCYLVTHPRTIWIQRWLISVIEWGWTIIHVLIGQFVGPNHSCLSAVTRMWSSLSCMFWTDHFAINFHQYYHNIFSSQRFFHLSTLKRSRMLADDWMSWSAFDRLSGCLIPPPSLPSTAALQARYRY